MRTDRQQTAIDVVRGASREFGAATVTKKRRLSLAAQLKDVAGWLEEEFPANDAPRLTKPVLNSEGADIGPAVWAAAQANDLKPWHLLALLRAESGLNQRAERWGGRTTQAKQILAVGNLDELQALINDVWPDISFGYSQRIVLYHDQGDRTPNVANVLAVRAYVFTHPEEDIAAAASRLAGCFRHQSCDGTALSAFVVYNAGSDRRWDPEWFNVWGGNVATYQRALEWAEQFS